MSITRFQNASSIAASSDVGYTPAFAARMSIRPCSLITRAAIASTEDRSVTSVRPRAGRGTCPELCSRFAGAISVDVRDHHPSPFRGEHRCDAVSDALRASGHDRDLSVSCCIPANIISPPMQRFSESDAKYSYSPGHEWIGTVELGEQFEVESVEGWSNYFRDPADFTPESHAQAEAQKWAVVGRSRSQVPSATAPLR